MVTTFRLDVNGPIGERAIARVGEHASLREASGQLPDGAYTTFRTYGGDRVLRLRQHVQRLEESVALLGNPAKLDEAATRQAVAHALRATGYPESRFRLTFAPPALFVSVEPFTPYPPSLYESGVWCVSVSLHRDNPHAKSTTFIASAADAYQALPAGAHEGLMIGEDGAVLEGLSSNFFAVMPSAIGQEAPLVLRTEEARVLAGVTRALVLEVAHEVLPVITEAVAYGDLPQARECFITSVSREILPVVRVDQIMIGDGKPGPITRALMQRFQALVQREAEPVL
ncbi:MAG: branched chain amino acid aminotransferase [Candidatus Roseilinea sp.]|nr:MAG: branched chain amino acid aminotransferase [Candidatus Roseilinea sp.]